ncbi:MAG TPA: type II toxin-antitoxin system VapC family toxin [Conexibacter sp.]
MLVVDTSVAVAASHSPVGLARFGAQRLVTPHLMRAEAASVLHEMVWRKEINRERGRALLGRLLDNPIELLAPDELTREAWRVADDLGWAKVYDAHYVELARLLGCKLVTIDERLLRGVARLGIAVRPTDI